MRFSVSVFVFLLVFLTSSLAFSEIKVLGRDKSMAMGGEWGLIDRVICVDGLKLFQTYMYTGSTNGGVSIATIQLYETQNGKEVPATCK